MELRRYLFEHRLTQVQFARMIDYDIQYLRGVISGRIIAGAKMRRTIEKITNGEVKSEDLPNEKRPEPFQPNLSTNKNIA
ncbi:MAG TPA: hypothetical protein VGK47_08855 [Nitrososphaeraceae archaeon]